MSEEPARVEGTFSARAGKAAQSSTVQKEVRVPILLKWKRTHPLIEWRAKNKEKVACSQLGIRFATKSVLPGSPPLPSAPAGSTCSCLPAPGLVLVAGHDPLRPGRPSPPAPQQRITPQLLVIIQIFIA